MTSKNVLISQEAYDYLNDIKEALTPPEKRGKRNQEASFSEAIIYHKSINQDIKKRIDDNFDVLYAIMQVYWKGDKDRLVVINQLRQIARFSADNPARCKEFQERMFSMLNEVLGEKR